MIFENTINNVINNNKTCNDKTSYTYVKTEINLYLLNKVLRKELHPNVNERTKAHLVLFCF